MAQETSHHPAVPEPPAQVAEPAAPVPAPQHGASLVPLGSAPLADGAVPAEGAGALPRTRRRTLPAAYRFCLEWVRSTPGTHLWLGIIVVTSVIAVALPPHVRAHLLQHVSTNLVELRRHPFQVLVASALWIEGTAALALYAVLFEVVHAVAERWMGTARWLATAAFAHVGATLISQRAVLFGINGNRLPMSLAETVDIGVSYGLAGVAGVLTYRVPRPWRWLYLAALLGAFGYRLIAVDTFTDLGHFTAVLLGLGCYALTPPGPGRRTPAPGRPRSRPRRWRG
jgi:hypothetical protein